MLPVYVKAALDEGYTIVHKGILCSFVRPTPALQPVARLLAILLEATFTYIFSAIIKSKWKYDRIGHIHFWPRDSFVYEGLCSHNPLHEGVTGAFTMTPGQREAFAKAKEERRIDVHQEGNVAWHHQQMANNYAEYMDDAHARVRKSRATKPEHHKETVRKRSKTIREEKRFYCELYDSSFERQFVLDQHLKSPKHLRKVQELTNPPKLYCKPCNHSLSNNSNLARHNKSLQA